MARQNFIGFVVSQGKMMKTVKVRVETKVFNKRINKDLLHRKDYLVHDEGEISREGDLVRIESTRPLSKKKFFAIAEIIRNKGQQFALYEEVAKKNVLLEESQKAKEFLDRRSTRESNKDSALLSDIRIIQNALSKTPEEQSQDKQLLEVKEKYGITDFTPEVATSLLNLDIMKMEDELTKQRNNIQQVQTLINTLMADERKGSEYLLKHGVKDPHLLKKNIKKNIIRKYALQDLEAGSQELIHPPI
ncbi:hypothetical protein TBLA_0G01610 [Henningerozyma blattae CBS 6284]|uniref:Uncharacterized protein n=1 Tax=Henningerozyma blattae (strain ATCC 34711 / CBS 6284 / DSM 70876 / NBRC 10599 / NRRL Y-10934 / UCD 77-7) TaxID=1071380 RepID=I2H6V3_HENB6|nr:hypothetical protein TBLA_0G01610 [Tetrapisispora blattae CBS 6284]CCH62105.1 hypothetical protein TBLA_0G01610 [Tetrapisispora blattae CBS 6284]